NLVVIASQPQRGSPSLRLFPGRQRSRKATFGSAPGKIVSDFVFQHMAYFKMRAEYRLQINAIEKSNSIRMTPPSSQIQMRRVRTMQESYYFAITNVHVIRGPFAFQPNKKTRPACAERGFSYRDPAARRRCALQPRRRAQGVDLVGLFPAEGGEGVGADGLLLRDAAEVAVGRGFLVHGVQQVEHAGDGVGAQVEHFAHQVDDGGFRY